MGSSGGGVTPWPDWEITLGLVITMLASQRIAYWIGGSLWVKRHAIHLDLLNKKRRISGFYGEALTTSLGGVVMFTVGALTPSVTIYGIVSGHPLAFAAVLALCVLLYALYMHSVLSEARHTERHWKPERFPQLRNTYIAYGPYSIGLYLGVIAIFMLLAMQYMADAAVIAGQRAHIIVQAHALAASLHAGTIDAARLQTSVEVAYGDILVNGSAVAASMNPVFMLIALATSIMILLERSPIRKVFLSLPRNLAQSTGVIALAAFFLLTTVTYYFSYAQLANEAFRYISGLRPALEHSNADWEIMRRFNEIVIDLGRKGSFIGFASTVIDESGAAVVWLALLQWLTTKLSSPPAAATPEAARAAAKGKKE
jgi:hypothetical protein